MENGPVPYLPRDGPVPNNYFEATRIRDYEYALFHDDSKGVFGTVTVISALGLGLYKTLSGKKSVALPAMALIAAGFGIDYGINKYNESKKEIVNEDAVIRVNEDGELFARHKLVIPAAPYLGGFMSLQATVTTELVMKGRDFDAEIFSVSPSAAIFRGEFGTINEYDPGNTVGFNLLMGMLAGLTVSSAYNAFSFFPNYLMPKYPMAHKTLLSGNKLVLGTYVLLCCCFGAFPYASFHVSTTEGVDLKYVEKLREILQDKCKPKNEATMKELEKWAKESEAYPGQYWK